MNFLGCEGSWAVGAAGEVICNGTPVALTTEDLRTELQIAPALTTEDMQTLLDETIVLFAVVFGFLALKKVL